MTIIKNKSNNYFYIIYTDFIFVFIMNTNNSALIVCL